MRVLYIAPPGTVTTAFGGIETYGRDLMAGVRQRGHTVEALVCDPAEILRTLTLADRVPRWEYRQRYYFWRRFFLQDFRYHNGLARLTRTAIGRFRPDVVHALHLYHTAAIGAAGERPTVVSCNGLEVEDVPPVRRSLERASAVHCVSDFTRGLTKAVVGNRRGVHTVTWGIRGHDQPRIDRSQVDFELVTVSRLVPRKNVDTVLRALAHLGDSTIRYAVIGDGPERAGLEALASELGLTNVRFLGGLAEDEKLAVLRRSQIFVMCPRHDVAGDVEGLGLVYFEAHGAGLVCVGARSGGAPEAIGEGGLLVDDARNHVDVAGAIHRALEPATYAGLCEAVRNRQQSHSWDTFLDAWERIYGSLVDER